MLKGLLTFGLTRRPLVLLGLLVFIAAGTFAFSRLNIEAYPNPAPVILEITAQSPGLSAEEMERYFTIPIEVGLAATPGVDVIRSTSFYGLSFVRVVFQYDVDYYFALTQTAINLQTAQYADKIFKGADPAELHVEQPVVFELALNLKTAAALGVSIPESVVARADRVIE